MRNWQKKKKNSLSVVQSNWYSDAGQALRFGENVDNFLVDVGFLADLGETRNSVIEMVELRSSRQQFQEIKKKKKTFSIWKQRASLRMWLGGASVATLRSMFDEPLVPS